VHVWVRSYELYLVQKNMKLCLYLVRHNCNKLLPQNLSLSLSLSLSLARSLWRALSLARTHARDLSLTPPPPPSLSLSLSHSLFLSQYVSNFVSM
jgi:hypothetical protein